jgi:stage V sporulation protein S
MEILKVGSRSHPGKVAGAIAAIIREGKEVQARAIGAGAVNQAIKAVIIARIYMLAEDVDLFCIPGFVDLDIGGEERTALTLTVQPR